MDNRYDVDAEALLRSLWYFDQEDAKDPGYWFDALASNAGHIHAALQDAKAQ